MPYLDARARHRERCERCSRVGHSGPNARPDARAIDASRGEFRNAHDCANTATVVSVTPHARSPTQRVLLSWAKRPRFWIFVAVIFVVGGLAFAVAQTFRAERSGASGRAALARAEQHLNERNVRAARVDLLEALGDFQQMHNHLGGMGPLAPVARITPFVRIQVRGADRLRGGGRAAEPRRAAPRRRRVASHRSDRPAPQTVRRAREARRGSRRVERWHRRTRYRG